MPPNLTLNAQAGAENTWVEVLTPCGVLRVLFVGQAGPPASFGTQAAWFVDGTTGDDNAAGSLVAPIRTLTELSRRLSNNVIQQATVVTLLGNAVGQLQLTGTVFLTSAATLTVTGVARAVATGSIVAVTPLGPLGTEPWQLQTAGLDWTLQTSRRIQFASGAVAWVNRVIDANNVVIGSVGLESGALLVPAALQTFSLQSLTTMPAPVLDVIAPSWGGQIFTNALFAVRIEALDLLCSGLTPQFRGASFRVFGCRFSCGVAQQVGTAGALFARLCQFTFAAATFFNGGGSHLLSGCTMSGSAYRVDQRCRLESLYCNGPTIALEQDGNVTVAGQVYSENTATAAWLLLNNARVRQQNFNVSGVAGNTGFGVQCFSGSRWSFVLVGTRPTVSGALGDTSIGGAVTPYAAIPFVNLNNLSMMALEV